MYRVEWSKQAKESLKKIGDRIKEGKIKRRIDNELTQNPYKGELLKGNLKGQRSFHLLGNRVRVVYEIYQAKLLVIVVEIGWREGFYKRLARKYGRK